MPARGGAFVSRGAQGCVVTPALRCLSGDADADAGADAALSKAFFKTDAFRREWGVARRLARLDPTQRFFVYPTHACDVAVDAVRAASEGQCDEKMDSVVPRRTRALPSVRMPHGGAAFNRWLVARDRQLGAADLARALAPVLDGLAVLGAAGLVHQDVKANNVLVDAAGRARLIDFGLHAPADRLADPRANPLARSRYWVLPPEYRLRRAAADAARRPPTNAELWDAEAHARDLRFNGRDARTIDALHRHFWRGHARPDLARLLRRGPPLDPAKVDVYGLGLVLMWAAQHAAALPPADGAFGRLVRGMTHADPARRWTPQQARAYIDRL